VQSLNKIVLIKARLGFTLHMMLWKSIIHLIVENAKSIQASHLRWLKI